MGTVNLSKKAWWPFLFISESIKVINKTLEVWPWDSKNTTVRKKNSSIHNHPEMDDLFWRIHIWRAAHCHKTKLMQWAKFNSENIYANFFLGQLQKKRKKKIRHFGPRKEATVGLWLAIIQSYFSPIISSHFPMHTYLFGRRKIGNYF